MLNKMTSPDWIKLGNTSASPNVFQEKTKKYILLLNTKIEENKRDLKEKKKGFKKFKRRNIKLKNNPTQSNLPIANLIKQEDGYSRVIENLKQEEIKSNLKLNQANRLDNLFTVHNEISNNKLNEIETLWNELDLESFNTL